ncbi:tyrosine-type recombinase/integrase [Algibacter miyuki]|uniref:Tyrosine-type recombinase/integrase n=1 Tax=Algibacter miyuki TaxID=1306933 RepID=A0ABV5H2D7_9FLAO|nr:site-specific integrase [Algibacter miyuki]MDN3664457.1 site-specific integrase [Algibacter miyuki]
MATIKFQVLGNSETVPVYLRLSVKRGLSPRAKTGLYISPKNWSSTNYPKTNTPTNKNLKSTLQKLETYVLDQVNNANSTGEEINASWLKYNIDLFFNRITETTQSDLLTDAIQSIINEAPTRKNAKGGIGLSKSRINAYTSLKNILTEYQKQNSFKVKDVNVKFAKDFLKYLLNTKNYQKSYALKKIADLKTVCNDASFYGIETSVQLKKIDSTKTKNENILFLNPKELQAIESAVLLNDALKNAQKWLLLGCNIGQRGGDLLQLNQSNFINRNGLEVIELKQQKTGKNVTIPVLEKTKEILKDGLPYKISIQKFNNHIKEVCRIAGIDEMITGTKILMVDKNNNVIPKDSKGKYISKGFKRKISGLYPKYELMASHVCRRSFASNLYSVLPTPLIMSITAHSSEKMLLNYIGKDSLDYAQQIADFYTLQAQKQHKKTNLTVIKNAVNN